MGLQQQQAEATNLRDRAQTSRKQAATDFQKVAQYRISGDHAKAQQHQDAADRRNDEAERYEQQAVEKEERATQSQQRVDQLDQEIDNLRQQINIKEREKQDIQGSGSFGFI